MSYRVEVERRAQKQLARIQREHRDRIMEGIDDLADDPRPRRDSLKLQGAGNLRRLRVGDYRVIYEIRDGPGEVLVLEVWHRQRDYR